MDKQIKSFEELENDEDKLNQLMMDHQRDVDSRREIDLDQVRKMLNFYKVKLEEISDSLYTEGQEQNQSSGSDYWSKRK
jgi:hypothetical protein